MNSLQPELKHQPNAIKTKLINSKFQSETAYVNTSPHTKSKHKLFFHGPKPYSH